MSETTETAAPEERDETLPSPDELTGFRKGGPAVFNRKKVMITLCRVFAAVVIPGFAFSTGKSKKQEEAGASGYAARAPSEFLRSELDRAGRAEAAAAGTGAGTAEEAGGIPEEETDPPALPKAVPVSLSESRAEELSRGSQSPPQGPQSPPPAPGGGGGGGGQEKPFTAHLSSLVPPVIEGSLFTRGQQPAKAGTFFQTFAISSIPALFRGQPIPNMRPIVLPG